MIPVTDGPLIFKDRDLSFAKALNISSNEELVQVKVDSMGKYKVTVLQRDSEGKILLVDRDIKKVPK